MADKFGLRTWILRFTCLVFKTTCIDAEKPLREGAFFFTRMTLSPLLDKRNTRDKEKGLLGHFEKAYRRGWACNALALEIEDGTLRQQSPIVVHSTNHYWNES